MSFEDAKTLVNEELVAKLQFKQAMEKAKNIKERVSKGEQFEVLARQNNFEIKGVKPFSRILPDSSQLPIPLISKIFESQIGDINIEQRGTNEIVVAKTVEILIICQKIKKKLKSYRIKLKMISP